MPKVSVSCNHKPVDECCASLSQPGPGIYESQLHFTPDEKKWRMEVLKFLEERERTVTQKKRSKPKGRLQIIDHALATLRIVNRVLQIVYNTPNWGNKQDLIDELVYILLSNRSKIEDAERQFNALKKKFARWEDVVAASPAALRDVIYGGGLEDAKVQKLQSALRTILERYGQISTNDLTKLDQADLREFLVELPGVGPKTSDCILMYAGGADVFPADAHCIRVLNRLGVFQPLGFTWEQSQHKIAEKDLATLVPRGMRADLHKNLIAHGREICKPNPQCNVCELKKFCSYYRQAQQAQEQWREAPTAIDMYSGAGGFSEGFRQAGFKIIAAIDLDPLALQTLKLNHPEIPDKNIIQKDTRKLQVKELRNLLGDRKLDVLIGGPPCQGFSHIGKRARSNLRQIRESGETYYDFDADSRNQLYQQMLRIAKALKPRYVVIENVVGLKSASSDDETYADMIKRKLERLGYRAESYLLKAEDMGIPQKRHRFVIVGAYGDETLPDFSTLDVPKEERFTLADTLDGLPALAAGEGYWITKKPELKQTEQKGTRKCYLERAHIANGSKILWSHNSRFNNGLDIELFKEIKPGEDYRELRERVGRRTYMRYSFDNFHDKYFRLDPDEPSRTIMAHLAKDGNGYIHPYEARTISVREAARIQSFPDDYIFTGSRGAQFTQIGNAVPPALACAIANLLVKNTSAVSTAI